MKAVIEFDLNEPDDVIAHKRAIKSLDLALAIWSICSLRKRMEYEIEKALNEDKNFTPYDTLEFLLDHINEILDEYHISIDDLIV